MANVASALRSSSGRQVGLFQTPRKSSWASINPFSNMAGDTYTLKYFNFRVLGEPIRWQFALAGVPFKDERYARDSSWDQGIKQKTGWGVLPILVINGNTSITQSTAISRYLAKKYGTMPEDLMLQTRCDELVDNLQDFRLVYRVWVRESDPAKKLALQKELKETHFPLFLPKVEKFVKEHGKDGCAVGDKLSWADLYLANFMQLFTDCHGEDIISSYPLLKQNMTKIINIPEIKKWNETRPVSF